MEKKIRTRNVIIALLAVMLIFNFIALFNLNNKLDNLNNNLNNGIQTAITNINSLRSEVNSIKEEKEKQASLITSFDYEYGELDENKMTVPVTVKIVPKSISESDVLMLELGSKRIVMKKDSASSVFTAEFETGIFENKDESNIRLIITNDGASKTEELDWSMRSLYADYLPSAAAYFAFSDITCNEQYGIKVEGNIVSVIDDEEGKSFSSIKAVYKVNGQVVAEEDIAGEKMLSVNKTFPGYGAGDTFELYLVAVDDEFGFTQERVLKRVQFGADGETIEETELADEETVIKDKEGKIVYP